LDGLKEKQVTTGKFILGIATAATTSCLKFQVYELLNQASLRAA